MTDNPATIVSKVWNYAHVLKNAEGGYDDYVEQITYLLFLKLADEMTELGFDKPHPRRLCLVLAFEQERRRSRNPFTGTPSRTSAKSPASCRPEKELS